MDDKLLQYIYNNKPGLKEKVEYDKFKADMLGPDPTLRNKVWQADGFEKKGIAFDKFESDLGVSKTPAPSQTAAATTPQYLTPKLKANPMVGDERLDAHYQYQNPVSAGVGGMQKEEKATALLSKDVDPLKAAMSIHTDLENKLKKYGGDPDVAIADFENEALTTYAENAQTIIDRSNQRLKILFGDQYSPDEIEDVSDAYTYAVLKGDKKGIENMRKQHPDLLFDQNLDNLAQARIKQSEAAKLYNETGTRHPAYKARQERIKTEQKEADEGDTFPGAAGFKQFIGRTIQMFPSASARSAGRNLVDFNPKSSDWQGSAIPYYKPITVDGKEYNVVYSDKEGENVSYIRDKETGKMVEPNENTQKKINDQAKDVEIRTGFNPKALLTQLESVGYDMAPTIAAAYLTGGLGSAAGLSTNFSRGVGVVAGSTLQVRGQLMTEMLKHPDLTTAEAAAYSWGVASVVGAIELGNPLEMKMLEGAIPSIVKKNTGRLINKEITKKQLQWEIAKDLWKTVRQEPLEEYAQGFAEYKLKQAIDSPEGYGEFDNPNPLDNPNQLIETGIVSGLVGLIGGAGSIRTNKSQYLEAALAKGIEKPELVDKFIKQMETGANSIGDDQKRQIALDEHQRIKERWENLKSNTESFKRLPAEKRARLAALILDSNALEAQISGVTNPAILKAKTSEVEAINNEIADLISGKAPADNAQPTTPSAGQPTDTQDDDTDVNRSAADALSTLTDKPVEVNIEDFSKGLDIEDEYGKGIITDVHKNTDGTTHSIEVEYTSEGAPISRTIVVARKTPKEVGIKVFQKEPQKEGEQPVKTETTEPVTVDSNKDEVKPTPTAEPAEKVVTPPTPEIQDPAVASEFRKEQARLTDVRDKALNAVDELSKLDPDLDTTFQKKVINEKYDAGLAKAESIAKRNAIKNKREAEIKKAKELEKAGIDVGPSIERINKKYDDQLADLDKSEKQPVKKPDVKTGLESQQNEDQFPSKNFLGNPNFRAITSIYEKSKGKTYGKPVSRTLPGGEKITGKYVLINKNDIAASHQPFSFAKTPGVPVRQDGSTFNDNDYEKSKNAQAFQTQIAQKYDARAIDDLVFVDSNGIVKSGNGRTISRQMASAENAKAYIDALKSRAEEFGFTEEQINAIGDENVMLAVEMEGDPVYSTREYSKFNAVEKKSKTPLEQAIASAKTIDDKTINLLSGVFDQADVMSDLSPADISRIRGILVSSDIITDSQLGQYFDENDKLTAAGSEFVENLLLASIFDEAELRILAAMPALRKKLTANRVRMIKNASKGNLSLVPRIREALYLVNSAKQFEGSYNSKLLQRISQGSLFGDQSVDGEVIAIAFMLNHTGQLRHALDTLNNAQEEADIFGNTVSSTDVVDHVLNKFNAELDEEGKKILEAARSIQQSKGISSPSATDERTDRSDEPGNQENSVDGTDTSESEEGDRQDEEGPIESQAEVRKFTSKEASAASSEDVMRNIAAFVPELAELMQLGIDVTAQLRAVAKKAGKPLFDYPFPYRLHSQFLTSNKSTPEKKEKDIANFKKELEAAEQFLLNVPSDAELQKIKEDDENARLEQEEKIKSGQQTAKEKADRIRQLEIDEKDFISSIENSKGYVIARLLAEGVTKDQIRLAKAVSDIFEKRDGKGGFSEVNSILAKHDYNIDKLIAKLSSKPLDLFQQASANLVIDDLRKLAEAQVDEDFDETKVLTEEEVIAAFDQLEDPEEDVVEMTPNIVIPVAFWAQKDDGNITYHIQIGDKGKSWEFDKYEPALKRFDIEVAKYEPKPDLSDDFEMNDDFEQKPEEEVFPAPTNKRNFTTEKLDVIPVEEAQGIVQSWKDYAKQIGATEDHSNEVIISIFDETGMWSQPYKDAGYTVIRYDLARGDDIVEENWFAVRAQIEASGKKVVGVLSAPPCTSFAGSGARWWGAQHDKPSKQWVEKKYGSFAAEYFDRPLDYAAYLVEVVKLGVAVLNPTLFHTAENPVGRIQKEADLPDPTISFNPNNFGDPYTKKTMIWGVMNTDLPTANVFPSEGSKVHKLRGDNPEQKKERSQTPEGFSYAFFVANNTSNIKLTKATASETVNKFTFDSEGNVFPVEVVGAGKNTTTVLLPNGKPTVRVNTELFDTEEQAKARVERSTEPTIKIDRKIRDKKIQKEIDDAWTDFIKGDNLLTAGGLDPKRIEAGVKLIGLYVKQGVYKFSDIIEDAYAKMGEKVEDYFDALKYVYSGYYNSEATADEAAQMDATTRGFSYTELTNKFRQETPAVPAPVDEKEEPLPHENDRPYPTMARETPKTVRELTELEADDATDYTAGVLLSHIGLGDSFKVGRDTTYTVTRKTNPRTVTYEKEVHGKKYTGSYTNRTVTIEDNKGKKLSYDLWDDWIQNGDKMMPQIVGKGVTRNADPVGQLSRDIEGDITRDLINENNKFHTPSDSFRLVQEALNRISSNTPNLESVKPKGDGNTTTRTRSRKGGRKLDTAHQGFQQGLLFGPEEERNADPDSQTDGGRVLPDDRGTERSEPTRGRKRSGDETAVSGTIPGLSNKEKAAAQVAQNYHFPNSFTGTSTFNQASKFRDNLEALKVLKTLIVENRDAIPEEQDVLVKYVGWGGLKVVLIDDQSKFTEAERKLIPLVDELNGVIAELEKLGIKNIKSSIKASVLNAHYTSIPIIRSMYSILYRMGFNGGKVLEPSAGVGHFLGAMPGQMAGNSQLNSIELEPLTGSILKKLYPKSISHIDGYENVNYPSNHFDLAISNIPFGDYKVYTDSTDPVVKKAANKIHNFFFVRALDQVKEGGMIAFLTTSGTLDSNSNKFLREHIDKNADFLGAIRLPNNAFQGNAGTQVVTDIIFLRKNTIGEKNNPDFINLHPVQTKHKNNGKDITIQVNEYFVNNPDKVIGEWAAGGQYAEDDMTVIAPKDVDIEAEILKLESSFPEDVFKPINTSHETKPTEQVETEAKDQSYFIQANGKPAFFRNGEAIAIAKTHEAKVAPMVKLRDLLRKQYDLELYSDSGQAIEENRVKLHTAYNAFVNKFGPLNSDKNKRFILQDVFGYNLISLEEYDKETNKAKKALILTERALKRVKKAQSASSIEDAIAISLNESGKVDLQRVAELVGSNQETVFNEAYGLFFKDTHGHIIPRSEYLSGNVKQKLKAARELVEKDPLFLKNVAELEKVQPEDVNFLEIDVNLGSRWIPTDVYEDFLKYILGTPRAKVIYTRSTDTYDVTGEKTVESQSKYGTARVSAYNLVASAMHGQSPVVRDKISSDPDKYVVNDIETQAARDKQEEIIAAFEDWIWTDLERGQRLSAIYNDQFNTSIKRSFDGSTLTIDGLQEIELRDHQKDAISMLFLNNGGIVDHIVGAGKTAVMIGAAIKMKQSGIANKPAIIALKSTIPDIVEAAATYFPTARILAPTENDFKKENRKALLARIQNNDWDLVIMSHDQFKFIPQDPDFEKDSIQEEMDLIEKEIDNLSRETGQESKAVRNGLEKRKQNLKVRLMNVQAKGSKDKELLNFSEIGIDHMFIDESQQFKNLPYATKINNIAGLGNPEGSSRAFNLLTAVRTLQRMHGGDKGTTFLSGTPISNSLVEMYLLLKYLRPERMKELGYDTFDAWVKNAAKQSNELEFTVTGTVKSKARFRTFINLPELTLLYTEIADVRNENNLTLPRPSIRGGAPKLISVAQNDEQQDLTNRLIEFASQPHGQRDGSLIGKPDMTDDQQSAAMLLVTNLSTKLSVDMRLIDPRASFNPDGKLAAVANKVFEEYKNSADIKGTQLIFSDVGTPKQNTNTVEMVKDYLQDEIGVIDDDLNAIFGEPDKPKKLTVAMLREAMAGVLEYGDNKIDQVLYEARVSSNTSFNAYDEIKRLLIQKGVPENEIAFIHSYKTDAAKKALFKDVNAGKVRVLLGSTQKLGTGVNVQKRIVAMHHVDAPWNPAAMTQRNGRGIRQKNMNAEVGIFYYGTERTLDAYKYQLIATKQKFIDQVKNGATGDRTYREGDGEDMGAQAIVAQLSGNPLLLEKAKLDSTIDRLKRAKRTYDSEQFNIKKKISENEQKIRTHVAKIQNRKDDLATVLKNSTVVTEKDDDGFEDTHIEPNVVINGKVPKDSKERNEWMEAITKRIKGLAVPPGYSEIVGKVAGLDLRVRLMDSNNASNVGLFAGHKEVKYFLSGQHEYPTSPTSFSPAINRMENDLKAIELDLDKLNVTLAKLQDLDGKPWPKREELVEAVNRQKQVDIQLRDTDARNTRTYTQNPEDATEVYDIDIPFTTGTQSTLFQSLTPTGQYEGSLTPIERDEKGQPESKNLRTISQVWSEDKNIQFYGTTRVENASDVAHIMRLLEDKSVEHGFVVHVDETGNSHIQHVSIGSVAATIIDPKIVLAGVNHFKSKKIYLVHNHPSGKTAPSSEDMRLTERVRKLMEPLNVQVEHVIMDTYNHTYTVIDQYNFASEEFTRDKRERGVSQKTHKLDGMKALTKKTLGQITTSMDAAEFVYGLRFSVLPKAGAIIMNRRSQVIGNYIFKNGIDQVELMNEFTTHATATSVILYGNQPFDDKINDIKRTFEAGDIKLLDYINVLGGGEDVKGAYDYQSASETGLMDATEQLYGTNTLREPEGAQLAYKTGLAPNGKRSNLTPDQQRMVNTPEFKKWFGDSKILDKNGEPLVAYHGTASGEFEEFDINKRGEGADQVASFGDYGNGFYFTPKRYIAEGFAQGLSKDENSDFVYREGAIPFVFDVFLKMEKPFDLRLLSKANIVTQKVISKYGWRDSELTEMKINEARAAIGMTPEEYDFMSDVEGTIGDNWGDFDIMEMIAQRGYDGIISHDGNEYVIPKNTQIKSASKNTGTFNPDSGNIRFSLQEAVNEASKASYNGNNDLNTKIIINLKAAGANDQDNLVKFSDVWLNLIKDQDKNFYNRGLELIKDSKYKTLALDGDYHGALAFMIADRASKLKPDHKLIEWVKGFWTRVGKFLRLNVTPEQLQSMKVDEYLDIASSHLRFSNEILAGLLADGSQAPQVQQTEGPSSETAAQKVKRKKTVEDFFDDYAKNTPPPKKVVKGKEEDGLTDQQRAQFEARDKTAQGNIFPSVDGPIAQGLLKRYSGKKRQLLESLIHVFPTLNKAGITVEIHENPDSYANAVVAAGGSMFEAIASGGFYNGTDIHINLSKPDLKPNVALHEAIHPIIRDLLAKDKPAFQRFVKEILADPDLRKKYYAEFALEHYSHLKPEEIDEEALVEASADIVLERILRNLNTMSDKLFDRVLEYIKKALGATFGQLYQFVNTRDTFKSFANSLADGISKGMIIPMDKATKEEIRTTIRGSIDYANPEVISDSRRFSMDEGTEQRNRLKAMLEHHILTNPDADYEKIAANLIANGHLTKPEADDILHAWRHSKARNLNHDRTLDAIEHMAELLHLRRMDESDNMKINKANLDKFLDLADDKMADLLDRYSPYALKEIVETVASDGSSHPANVLEMLEMLNDRANEGTNKHNPRPASKKDYIAIGIALNELKAAKKVYQEIVDRTGSPDAQEQLQYIDEMEFRIRSAASRNRSESGASLGIGAKLIGLAGLTYQSQLLQLEKINQNGKNIEIEQTHKDQIKKLVDEINALQDALDKAINSANPKQNKAKAAEREFTRRTRSSLEARPTMTKDEALNHLRKLKGIRASFSMALSVAPPAGPTYLDIINELVKIAHQEGVKGFKNVVDKVMSYDSTIKEDEIYTALLSTTPMAKQEALSEYARRQALTRRHVKAIGTLERMITKDATDFLRKESAPDESHINDVGRLLDEIEKNIYSVDASNQLTTQWLNALEDIRTNYEIAFLNPTPDVSTEQMLSKIINAVRMLSDQNMHEWMEYTNKKLDEEIALINAGKVSQLIEQEEEFRRTLPTEMVVPVFDEDGKQIDTEVVPYNFGKIDRMIQDKKHEIEAIKAKYRSQEKPFNDWIRKLRGTIGSSLAIADLSYFAIQGFRAMATVGTRDPINFFKAFFTSIRAMRDEFRKNPSIANEIHRQIMDNPYYDRAVAHGLVIAAPDANVFVNEYLSADDWFDDAYEATRDKKNAAGKVTNAILKRRKQVKLASNAAFATHLNMVSMMAFSSYIDKVKKATGHMPSDEELVVLARDINNSTGRSNIAPETTKALAKWLWAPKLYLSQILNVANVVVDPVMWANAVRTGNKDMARVYKYRTANSIRFAAFAVALWHLRKALADWQCGENSNYVQDSNKNQWLKITCGEFTFDPTGNMRQWLAFGTRMYNTLLGKGPTDIIGRAKDAVTQSFELLKYKLAPHLSFAINLLFGTDFMGRKRVPGDELASRALVLRDAMIPIYAQNLKSIYEAANSNSEIKGKPLIAIEALVGSGMNFISEVESDKWKERNDAYQKVKKAEDSQASKVLFETKYGIYPDLQGEFVTPVNFNEIEPTSNRHTDESGTYRVFKYIKDTNHDDQENDYFIVKKYKTGKNAGKKYRPRVSIE
jgi:N12 class adenine-specific DNA methylase